LAYVLPKESLYLLPPKIEKFLLETYKDNYEITPEIKWSFCKYFWESHVNFSHIDFKDLETSLVPFCG
jgi:hypothetical protein